MRRRVILGGWYALLLGLAMLAEQREVAVREAYIFSEPTTFSNEVGMVQAGEMVETTGEEKDSYWPVKTSSGKTGWIADSDLYSVNQSKTLKETTGAGAAPAAGQEGAYVKGFDPEVEGKYRADNPSLDKVYQEEVLPLIWLVRAGNDANKVGDSKALESKEEEQEKLWMQNRKSEADGLQAEIDRMRAGMQPARDGWQSALRGFRQAGKIGEFAGRK